MFVPAKIDSWHLLREGGSWLALCGREILPTAPRASALPMSEPSCETCLRLYVDEMEQKSPVVPFERSAVAAYLDDSIRYWRSERLSTKPERATMAIYYVDAFQSVRVSLFGETLSEE